MSKKKIKRYSKDKIKRDLRAQPMPDESKIERQEKEIVDTAKATDRLVGNDPAWYFQNASLAEAAGSLPFSYPTGIQFDVNKTSTEINGADDVRVPGIMSINFSPSITVSLDNSSPINVAAVNVYNQVRRMNSGAKNYDPADMMMYILAIDSMYSFHSMLRRAYGVATLYVPTNRYYPNALLTMMGFDADDFHAHLAQYNYLVNLVADKLNRFAVPSDYTLVRRHYWMNENLWTDSLGSKAQTYFFNQADYYRFNNLAATGSELTQSVWYAGPGTTPKKYADVEAFFNALYSGVMGDEDIGIMSGDILKAYGSNIVVLPETSPDYVVLPQYSQEVLSQIENARMVGNMSQGNITQNPSINNGAILYQPLFTGFVDIPGATTSDFNAYDQVNLLNMHKELVTPADVMVATRLMVGYGPSVEGVRTITSCGSEIARWMEIMLDPTDTTSRHEIGSSIRLDSQLTQTQLRANGLAIAALSQFDWHPIVTIVNAAISPDTHPNFVGYICDIDNMTLVHDVTLARLHEVATLSELYTKA